MKKAIIYGSCVLVAAAVFFGVGAAKAHFSTIAGAHSAPPFHVTDFSRVASKAAFLVFGDWGTGGNDQKQIAKYMAAKAGKDGAQFAVVTGDNFYPKGIASVSDPQWKTKYADIYTQRSLQIPFYVALGNHDYVESSQAQIDYTGHDARWRMPARYFSFTEPISASDSIEFFALDTTPIAEGIRQDITAQADWLKDELSHSSARWKIVYGHHPVYSNGEHGDTKTMREYFEPIFEQYHVDVYFCGHDHDVEVLKPVGGVNYIVSGGAAGHRDMRWGDNTIFALTNCGFVWCAATHSLLEAQCIDRNGKVEFAYDIRK